MSYPGQGRGIGEHDQEYRGEKEELEIVGEIPGPGRTHLGLRPEVVDVEEVPPPVLGAVGGVLHRTEGSWPESTNQYQRYQVPDTH